MIRRAIDALPGLLSANRELDLEPYKREMVTLFDLATRKYDIHGEPQAKVIIKDSSN